VTSTITIGSRTITVVTMPTDPGHSLAEISIVDSVAEVVSGFTGQQQTQSWPGADGWQFMLTLPKLTLAQSAQWTSFLMQLRGKENALQFGDPSALPVPSGFTFSGVCAAGNVAMSRQLLVSGLTPGATGVLLRGMALQVGYRMHRVLDNVDVDGSGKGTVPVWPSLREAPATGAALSIANVKGLFRLAANKRTWSIDPALLTSASYPVKEYR
jgi:hypothetical protein